MSMKTALQENVRAYRLKRKWTQQELAEALEVSVGAVSKWESGVSRPELETLMRLAELFGVSTDALLGFESGRQNAKEAAQAIAALRTDKRYAQGTEQAETALLKHPNHFQVAYESALLYHRMNMEGGERKAGMRALELYARAAQLLDPDVERSVSLRGIHSNRALVLTRMGKQEEALRLYRENNADEANDADIGGVLFALGRYEEALPPLSNAYLSGLTGLYNSLMHLGQCLLNLNRAEEGLAVIDFLLHALSPLVRPETPSYVDRMLCGTLTALGAFHLQAARREEAKASLREAVRFALRYDGAPNPYGEAIPHYYGPHRSLSDNLGGSLLEGIALQMEEEAGGLAARGLPELWRQVMSEEKDG